MRRASASQSLAARPDSPRSSVTYCTARARFLQAGEDRGAYPRSRLCRARFTRSVADSSPASMAASPSEGRRVVRSTSSTDCR